jgi:hypothetical protein
MNQSEADNAAPSGSQNLASSSKSAPTRTNNKRRLKLQALVILEGNHWQTCLIVDSMLRRLFPASHSNSKSYGKGSFIGKNKGHGSQYT